jgi:hypothetical protein
VYPGGVTIDAIREVLHRAVPFEIEAADGSVDPVKHPDFVSVGGTNDDGIVIVQTDSGFAILDLPNTIAIEAAHRPSTP